MGKRIYAYTVVGKNATPWQRRVGQTVNRGAGLIKVGETTRRTARERIKQQLGTAYPDLKGVDILLDEPALRADGSTFSDHNLHAALVAAGIQRPGGEWFEATLEEVKAAIEQVKSGAAFDPTRTESFAMRPEQRAAVAMTHAYFRAHAADGHAPKFLWNAKMRFGKTFATYQLAKALGWKKLLVLTYKPAVQAAWRDDLAHHVDFAGWRFIDRDTPEIKRVHAADADDPQVWFASFQDLNGRTEAGEIKPHNESIHLIDWDAIAIDEYHFGAWRDSARELYDPTDKAEAEQEEPDEEITGDDLGLKARHYLYLSGTPFRAITQGEFSEDQVYNWTYVDEQTAKAGWNTADGPNPYLALPRMEMYAYRIGDKAEAIATDGEFDGFSLNEYFKARHADTGKKITEPGACTFADPEQVSEFLELLRGKLADDVKLQVQAAGKKAPFPYESPDFAGAVRNAIWYMPDVASCFAMRDLLQGHAYFRHFEIVVAAGSAAGQGVEALPPVEVAIGEGEKPGHAGSITLSCGKLLTGVTVPEWGAIVMLRSLKSPESYFQAAFRVQSPWAERDAEGHVRVKKPTCYVFEFDPNRALSLVAEYGIKLGGASDTKPQDVLGPLINYLPIYAFDNGRMQALAVEDLLDWATAGIGATALANRWNSSLLVDVNAATLGAVLAQPDLLEKLEQIEDFRALVNNAEQVVTSTNKLKKAKREQNGELDPAQKREQSETAKLRKEIREKLQKFLAKIPVFMYSTDYREEALTDVIQSLDSALFERVTGLTVADFKQLSDLHLFNRQHMDMAIYQFKAFENASLHYADEDAPEPHDERLGLWDTSVIGRVADDPDN
ncbi:MAG TPA: GIY-YIG nuclease family protein [Rhodanobacteraceae bacterium]|nr:GIY-YIG nuclease family protein [Rhodanobacteraceae bacterium]